MLLRIKRKYPIVKTQHLLKLYGFKDEALFQLIEHPNELIFAIYEHECLLKPQKRDINKLATELANLNSINLSTIHLRLLQKWLAFGPKDQESSTMNDTIYEDFHNSPQEPDTKNGEYVARAHYILSSWKNLEAFEFLASELVSSQVTANLLQLYECFAQLSDDSTSLEVIKPDDYLHLKCCYYLKQLGMSFTVEKCKSMDKLALLKKIWTSHNSSAIGLEVMSYICLGYNVFLPQIWNGILKQMVALNMVRFIK